MGTRMRKYYKNNNMELKRTKKNYYLYENLYEQEPEPVAVELFDNVNEIDIAKVKEIVDKREEYKSMQKYRQLVKAEMVEPEPEYNIYEDIETKTYDINNILEEAKRERGPQQEGEPEKKLKNTQYNILTKLNLEKTEAKEPEMVTDFFTEDNKLGALLEKEGTAEIDKSGDLFAALKPTKHTVLTEPIKAEQLDSNKGEQNSALKQDDNFYTNVHSFVKEDFDEIHNLQGALKRDNKLIKTLLFILIILLIGFFIMFMANMFNLI